MAWNPFKKKEETDAPETAAGGNGSKDGGKKGSGGGASNEGPHDFDSNKAAKFFERAQTLHEATNFGYSMNMWIRGMRFDPTAMNGLEGFFKAAGAFFTENPKGEKEDVFKSTLKDASGKTDVDKYLTSLVNWSSHPHEANHAVKAMELAAGLGLGGPAVWIADRAVEWAARDKRPKKEHFVAAMKVYEKFDKFDKAVQAGEAGMKVDPTDGRLASDVKNLSAEWTTKRGGFDQTGEGGFRSNIRDSAKQRQMEERDRLVTTEEVLDRLVAEARASHEAAPTDRANALKFIEVLLKRGKIEDEDEASRVAAGAHERTQEYRFREHVDSIRVRQLRRKAAKLKAEAEKTGSAEAKAALVSATKEYVRADILAKEGQVNAYPTDLGRKFDLARLYYQVGKYEEAIALLQIAKDDAKNRARVYFYLGLSFQRIGWNDEAIETLRQAQGMQAAGDDATEMELRYGLMEALLARATEQNALVDADEAYKLASQIAIQNISYKEIRAKRDEIKGLIAKIKGAGAGAAG